MEGIVSYFLLKSLDIILVSRIPSLQQQDHNGYLSTACQARKGDKWFNLALGDGSSPDDINMGYRNLTDQMSVDIILVNEEANSYKVKGLAVETLMERWVIRYNVPMVMSTPSADSAVCCKRTYQNSIILLQSLYLHMRLLPAYRIFQKLSSSSKTCDYKIIYKVSSLNDPFSRADERAMKEYVFPPLEANPGRLCLSVTYRSPLPGLNLESSSTLQAKYSPDYAVDPTTEPFRYIPWILKAPRVQSPYSPIQRAHGWISGFNRRAPFLQNQALAGYPPAHCTSSTSNGFPSLPDQEHLRDKEDDWDDCDVPCPVDLSDVEAQYPHNSQNCYEENPSLISSDLPHSQDAALGILVHMLRIPQQLRQDSRYYSSPSRNRKVEDELSTASELSMPRKVLDALDELNNFRDKKDLLLSERNAPILHRGKN